MALVTEIQWDGLQAGNLHDKITDVRAFCFDDHGERIFQLDTFGRQSRKIPGKKSQTVQLDRKAAAQLVNQLREAFADNID